MKRFLNNVLAATASCALLSSGIASAQWGDLKLKFVVDGEVPKLTAPEVTKDKEICTNNGKRKVSNESFVVGKEGGLKEVVVFLVPEGDKPVETHPSYEATAKDKVTLDNKGCAFVPHIALVRTGQTLVITNSDPTGHNSQYNFTANKQSSNPLIAAKGEHKVGELKKREVRVQPVSCAIHPWMLGYVLIQDHPYMATSDDEGVLEIKNLPVGKHSFQMWQDNNGYVNPTGGKVKATKGKATIEIKEGLNDLGEVKVKYKAPK